MRSIKKILTNSFQSIWKLITKIDMMILSIITIGCIAVIIPLIALEDKIEGVNLSIEIVSSISSILTLILAIKLFDRFGIRKRIIDFQTDSVIKLIEELRITHCRLKGEKITYFIWFSRDQDQIKELLTEYKEDKKIILFHHGKNIIIPNGIEYIMNDLWLPEPIRDKMKFLDYGNSQVLMTPDVDRQKFMVIEFENENQDGFLIREELTSIEFLDRIDSLVSEIKNWLELHASIKMDLNLVPRVK